MAESILTFEQQAFVNAVGAEPTLTEQFYWTGGTVLAAEYLHHRLSDDIDLFTEADEVPLSTIVVWLKRVQKQLGYIRFDQQTSFNRNLFFLHYPDSNILKTEFTSFPFPRIELGPIRFGLVLDGPKDIAVNKLFTISQKPRARDYIDLYFLISEKGFDLHELMKLARIKFDWQVDPIQLGSRFASLDLSNWPTLTRPLTKNKLRQFFTDQAQKLDRDVFTD